MRGKLSELSYMKKEELVQDEDGVANTFLECDIDCSSDMRKECWHEYQLLIILLENLILKSEFIF